MRQMKKSEGDDFFNDLYEGGRGGPQKDDDYDDESRDEKKAKILSDLIKRKLKRRSSNTGNQEGRREKILASDVLMASTVYIPEVSLAMRENFVKTLEQELQLHYDSCETHRVLTSHDIKNCAAETELSISRSKDNIHMYMKEFADIFKSLRKSTKTHEIHTVLVSYVPFRIRGRNLPPKKTKASLMVEGMNRKNSDEQERRQPEREREQIMCDKAHQTGGSGVCHHPQRDPRIPVWIRDPGKMTPMALPLAGPGNEKLAKENRDNFTSEDKDPTDNREAGKKNLSSCSAIPDDWQRGMDVKGHGIRGSSSSKDDGKSRPVDTEQRVDALMKSKPMIKYFFESLASARHEDIPKKDVPSVKQERMPSDKYSMKNHHTKSGEKHDLMSSSSSSSGHHKPHSDHSSKRHRTGHFDTKLRDAADLIRKFLDPKYKEKRLSKDEFKLACRKLSYKLVNAESVNKKAAEKAVKELFSKKKFLDSEDDIPNL